MVCKLAEPKTLRAVSGLNFGWGRRSTGLALSSFCLIATASIGMQDLRAAAPRPGTLTKRRVLRGQIVKSGRLRVVRGIEGSEAHFQDEVGKVYRLSGRLLEELLRLDSHRLQIWARMGQRSKALETLNVSRYELLASGVADAPLVGMLYRAVKPERLVLVLARRRIVLAAAPNLRVKLMTRLGCKIWVDGVFRAEKFHVHRFGWLRCDAGRLKIEKGKIKKGKIKRRVHSERERQGR